MQMSLLNKMSNNAVSAYKDRAGAVVGMLAASSPLLPTSSGLNVNCQMSVLTVLAWRLKCTKSY